MDVRLGGAEKGGDRLQISPVGADGGGGEQRGELFSLPNRPEDERGNQRDAAADDVAEQARDGEVQVNRRSGLRDEHQHQCDENTATP